MEFAGLLELENRTVLGAGPVGNSERIVRFLYFPQMFDKHGALTAAAFPVDELMEEQGKSTSTTREEMALRAGHDIVKMCFERSNPERDRKAYGHAISRSKRIRAIVDQENPDLRLFCIVPDPVPFKEELDLTHSKVRMVDLSKGKAYVRGFRDKLLDAFCDRTKY